MTPYEFEIDDATLARFDRYQARYQEDLNMLANSGPSWMKPADRDCIPFWIIAGCKALAADPDNLFHYKYLAEACLWGGMLQRAVGVLEEAQRLDAVGEESFFYDFCNTPAFGLAILNSVLGRNPEAMEMLALCERRFPKDRCHLMYYRGVLFHRQQEFSSARDCYLECLGRLCREGGHGDAAQFGEQVIRVAEDLRDAVLRRNHRGLPMLDFRMGLAAGAWEPPLIDEFNGCSGPAGILVHGN